MALAVRCAHAQYFGGGGVLSMAKGTALFDAVAIFGTEAWVRSGRMRQCEPGRCALERVLSDEVRGPICGGHGCGGCAQDGGGVVRMDDGAVTFKGGTISNTRAVRARPLWFHIVRRM